MADWLTSVQTQKKLPTQTNKNTTAVNNDWLSTVSSGGTYKPNKMTSEIQPEVKISQPVKSQITGSLISKAKDTTKKVGTGTLKLLGRTGAGLVDSLAGVLDFVVDSQAREFNPISVAGFTPKKIAEVTNTWKAEWSKLRKEKATPTQKLKEATATLQAIPFLKPREEYVNLPLKEKFSKKYIGETVLTLAPSIVSSMIPYVINPALGVSVAVGSTAEDVKDSAIDNGVTPWKAEKLGIATGLLVGYLDRIIPDELFSKPQKSAFTRSLTQKIARIVINSGKEGVTEVAQETIQLLAESTFREIGLDEVKTRTAMSAFGGLIGGGGMTTIVDFANKTMKKGILESQIPDEPIVTKPREEKTDLEENLDIVKKALEETKKTEESPTLPKEVATPPGVEEKSEVESERAGEAITATEAVKTENDKLSVEPVGGKITLYHGSNKTLSKDKLDYGTFFTASEKEALDYAKMRGEGRGGKPVVTKIEFDPSEVRLNEGTGEYQYIGKTKNLSGGKYPEQVYRSLNDAWGTNMTRKEIDALPFKEVRDNASMNMVGGKDEFDSLVKQSPSPQLGGKVGGEVAKPEKKTTKKTAPKVEITPPVKKKVTKPKLKEKVFTKPEREATKKKTIEAIFSGDTQEEAISNIDSYFKQSISKPKTKADIQRLKTIRAEANRGIFQIAGANTGEWKRDLGILQTARKDESVSQVIDTIENGIAKIDELLEQMGSPAMKAPSGYGDPGGYSDIESTQKSLSRYKAIEMPEMVRITKLLLGNTPGLKKFKRYMGLFRSSGSIDIDPRIFEDPTLVAKVMAHEMGHMTDWLDTKTLKRGNLVGRIMSLNKFMKNTFGDLDNKELRKELRNLTQLWKPFDEDKSPESYVKYRYSSVELYADAISVLFNDPDLLREKAPKFWSAFFENIDKKPSVKESFFEIWNILNSDEGIKQSKRHQDVLEMFEKGEDKVLAIVKEKRAREDDFAFKLKYELIDRNQKVIDTINKLKKKGVHISDEDNPQYLLEEHNYVGGVVKAFVEENIDPIYKDLKDKDISWESLGEVLFHDRIVNERGATDNPIRHIQEMSPEIWEQIRREIPGGLIDKNSTAQLEWLKKKYSTVLDESGDSFYDQIRKALPLGIANPLGYDKKSSGEQLKYLESYHGDNWSVIQESIEKYRKAMEKITDMAIEEGLYTEDLVKQIKANPAYATFQVIDYLDLNISAKVSKQVGTLKDVANPATSTIIKAISTIKAVERNKVKRSIVKLLTTSGEIQDAKTIYNGKTNIPIDPRDSDLALFTVIEKGKLKGYYVDPYIAKTMEYIGSGEANAVVSVLKFFNNKLFRPLFITFNTGFQSFNLVRDFARFYKNTPGLKLATAVKRYAQAVPSAYRRAWSIPDATIREMENSKILGITYNDVISGMTDQDRQIDMVIARSGIGSMDSKKTNLLMRPINSVLDFIEKTGNLIETIPKVAGYRELNGKMPPKQLAQFIRTSIGSPDFMRRGAGYGWYNEVFLFSNAIKEGIRGDLSVATSPNTRTGFWFKTAMVSLLPKVIMFAGLAGAFGEALKKMLENASEYDKTNYTIVPMGMDENGKTIYLRIPQDETGRLIGGLFWKALRMSQNNKASMKDLMDIASYAGGQAPGLSPVFSSIYGTTQFLAGENPYDFFRGQNVIPDAEFEAGGKYALKPFLIWQLNNLGLGTFMRTYYTTQAPASKTWIQKVVDAPILSNILGRWIKVSDQGQREKNNKILEEVKQESATRRIEERNLINTAITDFRKGTGSSTSEAQMIKELQRQILGNPPYKDSVKTRATNIEKKFKLGILKGTQGQTVDSLIYASTNEEKSAILMSVQEEMEANEFKNFLKGLEDQGVISDDVIDKVKKGNDKTSFQIELPSLVKKAMASEDAPLLAVDGLVFTKDERTKWQKFLGKVSELIPGKQKYEDKQEAILASKLTSQERRKYFEAMIHLRKTETDWYYKNIGNEVEQRILGYTLGTYTPPTEKQEKASAVAKKYEGIKLDEKEKPIVKTFDEYEIPREVVFGIASAEGGVIGKNNIFNIGAYDSDPSKAIHYDTPEEGALAVAKLLSGTFTKADGKIDDRYKEAWENRKDPKKMLKMIEEAGYAGDPATWKERSIASGGAGVVFDSWSDFIMATPAWKKWARENE